MSHILLVEDDRDLGETLRDQLMGNGYSVTWCRDQKEFSNNTQLDFVAAVVDLNLPDGSGFDIIKKLNVPVVIMTALNTPENRLQGLELGAVDFIPKPFLFKELKLKLERMVTQHVPQIVVNGNITVDLIARTVESKKNGTTFLNDRELKTLKRLIEKSPQVVSRDELLDLWSEEDENASHRVVDNIIVRLRNVLSDEDHRVIKSVRGVGYQWMGENHES